MFTGIIQAVGALHALERRGEDMRLTINTASLDIAMAAVGDSIAVNGVCLTAVAWMPQAFAADVSLETLGRTTLGRLKPGARVNLEPALTPTARLGGHLVSGHVDGIGRVLSIEPAGRSRKISVEAPVSLARYIAEKGSVCIDGVSLTVNAVAGARFEVNVVPHTLAATIIGDYQAGTDVNVEVDLLARYLERLLQGEQAAGGVTREFLERHGFLR